MNIYPLSVLGTCILGVSVQVCVCARCECYWCETPITVSGYMSCVTRKCRTYVGASLSKLIQLVSWQTEVGARRRLFCPLCSLSQCQGKACLSTCCLSHGEAPGEGMSVECGYICMN